ALLLLDQYRQKSRLFRSPVLLVPLGDDFRYVESKEWDAQFNNYQKLFDYFNQHPELHIKVIGATEILYTLTLAEMRRFRKDGRLVKGFPAREHYQRLTEGRRSLGLFQHHDAIAGTGRDPVVIDYGIR
ncbi:hypothetical protein GOODEAATRI_027848, partial [Goodea atripinnis]